MNGCDSHSFTRFSISFSNTSGSNVKYVFPVTVKFVGETVYAAFLTASYSSCKEGLLDSTLSNLSKSNSTIFALRISSFVTILATVDETL
ncbi:hypothetical protein PGB90_003747 [Kerria lacca]